MMKSLNIPNYTSLGHLRARPRCAAAAQATTSAPPKTTQGKVYYVEQPNEKEGLYAYLYEHPKGLPASNIKRVEKEVTVTDMRSQASQFSLGKNGVELHKLKLPATLDWSSDKEIKESYYPLVESLLRKVTNATRVDIFDHTTRNGHLQTQDPTTYHIEDRNKPVSMVHVDYTAAGGLRRLHMLLPDEAETLQRTPFAVIQVWRPLSGPVQSSPLGVIDAATVDKKDLLNYRIEFPDRTGYNYGVKHNPKHRWYYADRMDVDEAYVFVCYDSRQDRARFTPHTGFLDLSSLPGAPPRQSIEIRSLCFFENEPQQEIAADL